MAFLRAYENEYKKYLIELLKQEGFYFSIFTLTIKKSEKCVKKLQWRYYKIRKNGKNIKKMEIY